MPRPNKLLKFTVREFEDDRTVSTYQVPLVVGKESSTSQTQPEPTPFRAPERQQEREEMQFNIPLEEESHPQPQIESTPTCSPWELIKSALLRAHYEEDILKCAACSASIGQGHVRCRDCGQQTYYCSEDCCRMQHTYDRNPFHKPLKWEVFKNKYVEMFLDIQFVRPNHSCLTQQPRYGIQVYDSLGRIHTVSIVTCGCEKDVITMFRHGLWASTIDKPQVAFHIGLLDTAEFAMLEGKMSLHAFCQTMRWRNSLTSAQCQRLYTCLRGEPMGQYRHFKHIIRSLSFLSPDLAEEVAEECIACPREDGKMFISFDANFGLVRKKGKDANKYQPNYEHNIGWICPLYSETQQIDISEPL